MKIFNRIKSVKYHIENLKNQIPYIKDQQKLNKHIDMINEIILLINDVEFMIDHKINSKVIDKLVLAHMHLLFKNYGTENGIDLNRVVLDIDEILVNSKELQEQKIISLIESSRVNQLMKLIPVKETTGKWKKFGTTWNKTKIDQQKISKIELMNISNQLAEKIDYKTLLIDLLKQFKHQIVWN